MYEPKKPAAPLINNVEPDNFFASETTLLAISRISSSMVGFIETRRITKDWRTWKYIPRAIYICVAFIVTRPRWGVWAINIGNRREFFSLYPPSTHKQKQPECRAGLSGDGHWLRWVYACRD